MGFSVATGTLERERERYAATQNSESAPCGLIFQTVNDSLDFGFFAEVRTFGLMRASFIRFKNKMI